MSSSSDINSPIPVSGILKTGAVDLTFFAVSRTDPDFETKVQSGLQTLKRYAGLILEEPNPEIVVDIIGLIYPTEDYTTYFLKTGLQFSGMQPNPLVFDSSRFVVIDTPPAEMRQWRALVSFTGVSEDKSEFSAVLPAWSEEAVKLEAREIPEVIQREVIAAQETEGCFYCYAYANLGATRVEDLHISRWELP